MSETTGKRDTVLWPSFGNAVNITASTYPDEADNSSDFHQRWKTFMVL